MPLYVYQVIEKDGSEGEVFEVFQAMADAVLTRHPENGKKVKKLLSVPNAPKRYADLNVRSQLSDKSLGSKGFTKYVKAGDGKYEKTAGSGPDLISGS